MRNACSFGKRGCLLLALNIVQSVSALSIVQMFLRVGTDQTIFAVTDKVGSACATERVDDDLSVFGAEILKQGALLSLFFLGLGNENGLFRVGVKTRIEHTSRDRAGGRVEVLYLFGVESFFFEEERKLDGIGGRASGVRGHEIRHKILLHIHAFRQLVEAMTEFFINADVGLAHGAKHVV